MLQFCWSRGGYLAEVTSAEEQSALEAVLIHGKEYWLGLTDVEEQGAGHLMSRHVMSCHVMSCHVI